MSIGLPWFFLFPALAMMWSQQLRPVGFVLAICGLIVAFAVGQLQLLSAIPLTLLLMTGMFVRAPDSALNIVGTLVFLACAVALGLHLLPGFNNPRIFDVTLSAGAPHYRMYLNLDKLLVGLWLVYAWQELRWRATEGCIRQGLAVAIATIVTCLGLSYVLGWVDWDPKTPRGWPLWLLNNLLLVSFVEEAFFRGFVQEGLSRLWRHAPQGETAALVVSAALFGLAHLAGGPALALLATLAGIGYGLAFNAFGLRGAVLTHVALNSVHFFLFTYPMH